MRVRLVQNTYSNHHYIEMNPYDSDEPIGTIHPLNRWKDFDTSVLGRNKFDVYCPYVNKTHAERDFARIKAILASTNEVVDQFMTTDLPLKRIELDK